MSPELDPTQRSEQEVLRDVYQDHMDYLNEEQRRTNEKMDALVLELAPVEERYMSLVERREELQADRRATERSIDRLLRQAEASGIQLE